MAKLDKATDARIKARARSWTRAQVRHEANRKANEAQARNNLAFVTDNIADFPVEMRYTDPSRRTYGRPKRYSKIARDIRRAQARSVA